MGTSTVTELREELTLANEERGKLHAQLQKVSSMCDYLQGLVNDAQNSNSSSDGSAAVFICPFSENKSNAERDPGWSWGEASPEGDPGWSEVEASPESVQEARLLEEKLLKEQAACERLQSEAERLARDTSILKAGKVKAEADAAILRIKLEKSEVQVEAALIAKEQAERDAATMVEEAEQNVRRLVRAMEVREGAVTKAAAEEARLAQEKFDQESLHVADAAVVRSQGCCSSQGRVCGFFF